MREYLTLLDSLFYWIRHILLLLLLLLTLGIYLIEYLIDIFSRIGLTIKVHVRLLMDRIWQVISLIRFH